jgi:hypothetical protein
MALPAGDSERLVRISKSILEGSYNWRVYSESLISITFNTYSMKVCGKSAGNFRDRRHPVGSLASELGWLRRLD